MASTYFLLPSDDIDDPDDIDLPWAPSILCSLPTIFYETPTNLTIVIDVILKKHSFIHLSQSVKHHTPFHSSCNSDQDGIKFSGLISWQLIKFSFNQIWNFWRKKKLLIKIDINDEYLIYSLYALIKFPTLIKTPNRECQQDMQDINFGFLILYTSVAN